MGILDEDVARVREATDIVGLIGEHVALKRSGARFTGLCPFHGEKTPSFSVNPQLGFYYCFGCQESGDAITFVRKVDGLDFAEAVERLAVRAGITLRYDTAGATQDRRKRERAHRGGAGGDRLLPPAAARGLRRAAARAGTSAAAGSTATRRAGSSSDGRPTATTRSRATSTRRSSRATTSSRPGSRS